MYKYLDKSMYILKCGESTYIQKTYYENILLDNI